MPEERRHESSDLEDYEVLDASDTLDGAPGDDPLDRGVATPERWSAAMKFGSTAEEQEEGESLDQLLAEEEPDIGTDPDGDRPDRDWDENATDEDIIRLAVKGMMPRNRLARKQITKLKIYAGPEHPHIAQKPQPLEIEA